MESTAILRQWFDRVDSEKTGNITAAQLKSALVVGNLEFPITVVQQMSRMYDFDRNGTMNFEALTCFLRLGEALLKIGFSLDSSAFYTVCESFDEKKNGRFRFVDFISLCIFVQSARFVTMISSSGTSQIGPLYHERVNAILHGALVHGYAVHGNLMDPIRSYRLVQPNNHADTHTFHAWCLVAQGAAAPWC
ncbi:hypothetical protein Acr_06g0016960 [Actinidia rufa]|uniref:EF-hand domain-containing protein n=1 Tax=Actinidia rufa TaxID=165716 RepID=A0A7J0EU67_9ERIC|nr:hypothetical protein Acr_06g0016960 [Actinidia rufa]